MARKILRTKEELIAAQRRAREAEPLGDEAAAGLLKGRADEAIATLAVDAANLWRRRTLAGFDLKGVDEQGHLLANGEVEWRPRQEGVPGREVITWKAGEHLDDVLAEGARRVEARARAALEKPAPLPENIARGVSTLKPGELLVVEADPKGLRRDARDRLLRALDEALKPTGQRAIVLEGPVKRESVEHLRGALREVGYDVVPLAERTPVPAAGAQAAPACAKCGAAAFVGVGGPLMFCVFADGRDMEAPICEPCVRAIGSGNDWTIRDGRIVPSALGADPAQRGHGFDGITCRCSRAVPKAECFATDDGWRCAVCTAATALDALQGIARMLDLPAGGYVAKVVPEAVQKVLLDEQAWTEARDRLRERGDLREAFERCRATGTYHKILLLEEPKNASPEERLRVLVQRASAVAKWALDSGATETETLKVLHDALSPMAPTHEELEEMGRKAAGAGVAVFDEVRQFTREDYEAVLKRAGEHVDRLRRPDGTYCRADTGAAVEEATGDPEPRPIATFADLLAAGKPAKVFVLEEMYGARRALLYRLEALGGAQGGAEHTVVTFRGGIEVTLFHEAHQAYGASCDVAVGFSASSSARLLDGSPIGLDVPADRATDFFWGLT